MAFQQFQRKIVMQPYKIMTSWRFFDSSRKSEDMYLVDLSIKLPKSTLRLDIGMILKISGAKSKFDILTHLFKFVTN